MANRLDRPESALEFLLLKPNLDCCRVSLKLFCLNGLITGAACWTGWAGAAGGRAGAVLVDDPRLSVLKLELVKSLGLKPKSLKV